MNLVRTLLVLPVVFALVPARPAKAAPTAVAAPEYHVRFYHTHTNERIDVVYRRGDTYDPQALAQLNQFLRDYRTGDVRPYDPRVFDLLHDLGESLGQKDPEFNVICAYRTEHTNEMLRSRSVHTGVAKHSLHMLAEAIDIRLPGVATTELRNAALGLARGGVGYYQASDFVHVDVGRVRRW